MLLEFGHKRLLIIDILLYEPQKHMQKFTKALRQNIQVTGNGNFTATPSTSQRDALKFGSININGLGIVTGGHQEPDFYTQLECKLQYIRPQFNFVHHQVLAISETKLRSDRPGLDIRVEGFNPNPDPQRAECSGTDKTGGGLCLLFKSNLSPHHDIDQLVAVQSCHRSYLTIIFETLYILNMFIFIMFSDASSQHL